MDFYDPELYSYFYLTGASWLTWWFKGWPEGDMKLKLHLSLGKDLNGRPAIIVNLHRSYIHKVFTLGPLYAETSVGFGSRLRIAKQNEGLVATYRPVDAQPEKQADFLLFQPQTFLLFEAHGNITEGIAGLEVGPNAYKAYNEEIAGVINFEQPASW